jgi:hypothetical protein
MQFVVAQENTSADPNTANRTVGKGYEDRTLPTVPWEKGIKTGRKQKIKS